MLFFWALVLFSGALLLLFWALMLFLWALMLFIWALVLLRWALVPFLDLVAAAHCSRSSQSPEAAKASSAS